MTEYPQHEVRFLGVDLVPILRPVVRIIVRLLGVFVAFPVLFLAMCLGEILGLNRLKH